MSLLLQNLIDGVASGFVYAVLGIGLVLVHRVSGVINFAHGSIAMVAVYAAYHATQLQLPFVVAVSVACVVAATVGLASFLLIEKTQRAGHHSASMMSIAILMVLEGLAGTVWGHETKAYPHVFATLSHPSAVIAIIACLLVLGVSALFRFTDWGLRVRAIADDAQSARLLGITPRRTIALSWVFASVLAAVAGLLIVPTAQLDPSTMFAPFLKAFVAAVVGGLRSFVGVVVGGCLLGVLEALLGAYVSTQAQASLAFVVLFAVLALRPEGLIPSLARGFRR